MGLLGGILGGVTGVLGGLSRNKAIKKQMAMVREQRQANRDWYDRRYNEDATQRADAQAILTQTAEMIKQRNQASAGAQAVMGGTEESVAAAKEANAKALSDATSQIAVAGEARKDRIEQQYRQQDAAYADRLMELQGQKQGIFDLANSAVAGVSGGMAAGV